MRSTKDVLSSEESSQCSVVSGKRVLTILVVAVIATCS